MRGSRIVLSALAGLALASLGAAARAAGCEQPSSTVFVIHGATDRAMADCVAAKLKPTTTELVIDSQGGPVDAALDIAEKLSTLPDLTIRIDGQCSSSCANYVLPLGRRLTVGRQAIIMLHGGFDGAFVAKAAPDERAATQALAERQKTFARARQIPPGWLFYRTAEAPRRVDGLDGAFRWPDPDPEYYLAETPLLRSCLPWLDVEAYDVWLKTQMTPARMARLKKNRIQATGTIVCNGRGW